MMQAVACGKAHMDLPFNLISTDFDATLFAEFENPPVPLELQQLIGKLQARGAKWVINTGRDLSSLMETLGRADLSIEPDYLVLVEREIHCHQQSSYVGLRDWNCACTRIHAELFARLHGDVPRLVEWINSRFHTRIYEDAYSPLCLVASNTSDMDAIHEFLNDYCRSVPLLTVVRNDVYARFSHQAYNKGTALAEVSRQLGTNSSRVFAIGDHLNDLPMLSKQFANFLAAPANAVPQVQDCIRRQGGLLCAKSHGQGVAEAIKFYLAPTHRRNLRLIND
jgi:hydroxymethylpyrimidine pyrophosphatase-like HAD family hydrolase